MHCRAKKLLIFLYYQIRNVIMKVQLTIYNKPCTVSKESLWNFIIRDTEMNNFMSSANIYNFV